MKKKRVLVDLLNLANPQIAGVGIFARNLFHYWFVTKMEYDIVCYVPAFIDVDKVFGIKASLVKRENYMGSNGIKPIIYIEIMSDGIDIVLRFGGKIIAEPVLLRQKNKNGDIIIGTNLIDGQVGYYAEIQDSEGNHCYLYSHS